MNDLSKKRICFLSGTRADFGKMSSIIRSVETSQRFKAEIVATGMHMLRNYGYTIHEIYKAGFTRVFPLFNQDSSTAEKMDIVLASTLTQLSHYISERRPDLLIVHGDRVEALAGSIAGALNGVLVGHFEGGEVSGTIDESMRHAITKMAHAHFVANETAKNRLLQLGEAEEAIYVVGSPEVDVMLSDDLPSLGEAQTRYEIPFDDYAIFIYHPVTTESGQLEKKVGEVIAALEKTGHNYIALLPNNDLGTGAVTPLMRRFGERQGVRLFPSLRFEYYLTLLKHARYIVGNSSSGIREAPVYGVPCVNVGTRQANRGQNHAIVNVPEAADAILKAIESLPARVEPCHHFGKGGTVGGVMSILQSDAFWNLPRQKVFFDR